MKLFHKLSKKHYISFTLAAMITCVVLYALSPIWQAKRMRVEFDASADKIIEYQALYTETPEQNLDKEHSVKIRIPVDVPHVSIDLPTNQLVKFRLEFGYKPGRISIKNLQIKGSETLLFDNISAFSFNQIDNYHAQDGEFTFYSLQNNPFIELTSDLNLQDGIDVDWLKVIVIGILTFLLAYKLIQYLTRSKA